MRLDGRLSRDAILAAIATTIAWGPLMRKRISRLTAETLPWYLRLYGVMIGASISGEHHQLGLLWGIPREERFGRWTMADFLFLALTGKKPTAEEALPLQILIGLLISNGPGSISAQGAKGAVSADGPQTPGRVQINKAMVGFLTHSGYSHGGNGFEGMAFLLEQFKDADLRDPTDPNHGLDLKAMATEFAEAYKGEKSDSEGARHASSARCRASITPYSKASRSTMIRASGSSRSSWSGKGSTTSSTLSTASSCRHSTIRGPRPTSSASTLTRSSRRCCWRCCGRTIKSGALSEKDLETAAFNVFLYGRMIGAAAEIDDHLNRGRNMDTRTPVTACGFVV